MDNSQRSYASRRMSLGSSRRSAHLDASGHSSHRSAGGGSRGTNNSSRHRHRHHQHQHHQPSALKEKLEEEHGNALSSLKQFGYRLVVLGAIGLGLATYFLTVSYENETFQQAFVEYATALVDGTAGQVDGAFAAVESFSVATTSSSSASSSASAADNWPNYTIANFDVAAANARFLACMSPLLVYGPVVRDETERRGWEEYAQQNKGLAGYNAETDVPERVHNWTAPLPATAPGPFEPLWQVSPPLRGTAAASAINLDLATAGRALFGEWQLADNIDSSTTTTADRALLSRVIADDLGEDPFPWWSPPPPHPGNNNSNNNSNSNATTPRSVLLQPIFTNFGGFVYAGGRLGGHFSLVLVWQSVLRGVALPRSVKGGGGDVVAVLSDECGRGYTFLFDGGSDDPVYVGPGDRHDSAYDALAVSGTIVDGSRVAGGGSSSSCRYVLYVYPTPELAATYRTSRPAIYTAVVVLVVLGTAAFFALVDWRNRRRERALLAKAERTHAIVTQLFPESVQQRLITDANKADEEKRRQMGGRLGLKSYLNDGMEDRDQQANGGVAELDLNTKPIADLFPSVTLMFCDIVGFTAWSSVREPAQIFTLLETIFRSFDVIAKRKGVFKVETVGDCYVAVCGLPEPRDDHAVAMARFARQCMRSMHQLMPQLEVSLGPDTGELDMRFGLHSGPVTAGVLRGEKARFQLFGDTMNTCARIETSSQAGKIHVSLETAELLMEAGKKSWIQLREDVVIAKGKGALETFWLITRENKSSDFDSTGHSVSGHSMSSYDEDEQRDVGLEEQYTDLTLQKPPKESPEYLKVQRLIDWNCELLLQLLRKIVARRRSDKDRTTAAVMSSARNLKFLEGEIGSSDNMVSDEIVEVISMPPFDAQAAKDEEAAQSVELPEVVIMELRMFISMLSSMYRDNPFHCFEHASHVTMSVSKLLARIVAPEAVADDGNESDEADLAERCHDHTYGITSDPLTQFAVVLSALIHDVDHRGVPNFVLIKEDPALAGCYNNKSVAEQNSVDLAWNTLMDPSFENLRRTIYSDDAELRRFRQLVVNSVMATDIFDKDLSARRKERWNKAFSETASNDDSDMEAIHRKATIVIEHLIQASDVAHTMQHWHIYQKWNARLFEEMYSAYRKGRMENDPSGNWYQGEIGFFDNYIIPLAKKLRECGVFGVASDEYLNYATKNRSEWETKGFEVVQKLIQTMREKYPE